MMRPIRFQPKRLAVAIGLVIVVAVLTLAGLVGVVVGAGIAVLVN